MIMKDHEHIVNRFDDDMNAIAREVDSMGELAIDQLKQALVTLQHEDPDAARKVIERDRLVNDFDVAIDQQIILLIARRQPVASDLREIVVLGKIVTELERSGDEARKIAGLTVHFYDGENHPPSEQILRDIHSMANYVLDMMAQVMQAFSRFDLALALEVLRMNDNLDDEFRSVLRRLSTFILEDARNIGHYVDIVLGIRALDRYGCHAKNIAGHIIFFVKGIDVRHKSAAEIIDLVEANSSPS